MRNTFRSTKLFWLLLLLTAPALAQNGWQSQPSPAVSGPAYNVSAGYTNLMMAVPGAPRVNLNGIDAGASLSLSSRWDAVVDSSYLRTSGMLGTPHQGYMLNPQAGAAFYPMEHGDTRLFVRGLAGLALVDGAVPRDEANYFRGWLLRPSFAFGGGVEHALSTQFLVRLNADYLRTSFYDAAGAIQGQNNLRFTASLVFRLKQHLHRSAPQVE